MGPDTAPVLHEVTIDGQKMQVTQEDLIRSYQLGSSSRKRFEEAASARKEAAAMREAAAQDPMAFLREHMGQEQLQYSMEQEIARMLQLEQMDPAERQRIEVEQQRQQLLQERQQWENEQQERKLNAQAAEYEKQVMPHFAKALRAANVEPDGDSIARMAGCFQELLAAGQQINPMTLQYAAEQVANEQGKAVKGRAGRLKGEDLLRYLGDEVVDEVRRGILARVQTQQPQSPARAPTEAPAVPTRRTGTRRKDVFVSLEDVRDNLEESRNR
jgi:molybdopterin converting factor small subunit